MKKFLAFLLAMIMVLALAACGDKQETTPSTGSNDSEYDPNKEVEFTMQTSADNSIVTIGDIDKSLYEEPILVTSFGQSKWENVNLEFYFKAGVTYTYDAMADASVIPNYKTVVIAVGASSKGLGAAGISEADETARAEAIIKAIQDNDVEVICCHIGGSSRRGSLSDTFADMVMAEASYIVLKEDANFDYKFTNYAEENNKPITLIYSTKDTLSVFSDLFTK